MSKSIPERELMAYRTEFRNGLFRQIHRRLRQLKGIGFTQKRMAQRLGMDEGQLSRCLNGDTDLRLETLSDLARALGCRISATLQPLESHQSKAWTTVAYYQPGNDNDNEIPDSDVTTTDGAIRITA